MKKKFRLLAILLICFLSTFTFIGCGDNPTNPPEPVYNTVSFVTNGGSAVSDKSCDIIEVSPTTLRDYYNFLGWFFDRALTRAVSFPLSVDNDMTLYAKWEKTREKTISDCMAYIDSQTEMKLFSKEDNSDFDTVNITNTTVTHIGNNFRLDWERGLGDYFTEGDNLITREYSLYLIFEYGSLESATGYFDYTYKFTTSGGDTWAGLNASYKITSLTRTGDTYLLNGYYTLFNVVGNYNETEIEVKNSLQSTFMISLYDFKFLFPVEYWDTIFDFA